MASAPGTSLFRRRGPAIPHERGLVDLASPSAEPFRGLRLALSLRPEARSGNAVLFTSAEGGEGKSTIAANYALVASLGQANVLLVDGDLRRPVLHELFGLPRSPGLIDALSRPDDLLSVAHRVPSLGRLWLLTAGTPVARVGDIASSTLMHDLLRKAKAEFDLVVIDSPPMLPAADARSLAGQEGVDVVMVADRYAKKRLVRRALRDLELIEANVLGLVVNRDGRLANYGYG